MRLFKKICKNTFLLWKVDANTEYIRGNSYDVGADGEGQQRCILSGIEVESVNGRRMATTSRRDSSKFYRMIYICIQHSTREDRNQESENKKSSRCRRRMYQYIPHEKLNCHHETWLIKYGSTSMHAGWRRRYHEEKYSFRTRKLKRNSKK